MANELPEVIPIPAALIPAAEELSSADLIFLLQGGHFKKLPATAFKGDAGDPATGLSVGGWKVALFQRNGGTNRLYVIYRLIKSAGALLWIEFAGNMEIPGSINAVYSYNQLEADEELSGALCSLQSYWIYNVNQLNFTARMSVHISNNKIIISVSHTTNTAVTNAAWSLDGIFYNLCQALPAKPTPPEDPAIAVVPSTQSLSNTSGTLEVTVTAVAGGWTAGSLPSWLSLSQTNGNSGQTVLALTYAANTNYSPRNATVTFTHASDTSKIATLSITQAATPEPIQKTVQINFEKIAGTQNTDTINVWLSTTDTIIANVTANITVSSHGYTEERTFSLTIYGGQTTSTVETWQTYIITDPDFHITLNNYSPSQDNDGAYIEIIGNTE
jgi:hypothetical protein